MEKTTYRTGDGASTSILRGPGAREELGELLQNRVARIWIVDANVAELHKDWLQTVGAGDLRIIVPAGESSKSRARKAAIEDEMFAAGVGRDATIVAVGGGVVGDLAGYIAATYMRGIEIVQVPTSVVAMVDSSIGGKTGIDIPAGKNLIGAFKHPSWIVTDVNWLPTLPQQEYRDGFAEVIKHAAIRDRNLWDRLRTEHGYYVARDRDWLHQIVSINQDIKVGVVTEDTQESGLRKILNFGHTLGHAIEHWAEFHRSHGQCVAEGMVLEARLGEALGIADAGLSVSLAELLKLYGFSDQDLRSKAPIESLIAITRSDKKNRAGRTEYALCNRVGDMAGANTNYGIAVTDETVRDVLKAYYVD